MGRSVANCRVLLRAGMNLDQGSEPLTICISIDVERDYRLDGAFATRGIEEGLPPVVDLLRSRELPFDLFVSGEIADRLPATLTDRRVAIGCHGLTHPRGHRSYLNQMTVVAQRRQISDATERVRTATGTTPIHFRAPNFSADARTISILEELGYRVDSSVLPGRYVKRLRVLPLLDHRGAPRSPYHPDSERISREGESRMLEVPVTPNTLLPGGPLGMGFLNASGVSSAIRATSEGVSKCVVFLAHSWEMVDWSPADAVAPWVRRAASSHLEPLSMFLDHFPRSAYVNMDRILERWTNHPRRG